MAASAIARAAAEGPMGAIGAGMTAAATALAHVEVPRMLKKQRDMFSWQCRDLPQSNGHGRRIQANPNLYRPAPHRRPERERHRWRMAMSSTTTKTRRPRVRSTCFVAKDTGLPLRIEMVDPAAPAGSR